MAHHLTVSLSDLNLDAFERDSDHDAGDALNKVVAARCSDPDDLLAWLPHAHRVHPPSRSLFAPHGDGQSGASMSSTIFLTPAASRPGTITSHSPTSWSDGTTATDTPIFRSTATNSPAYSRVG